MAEYALHNFIVEQLVFSELFLESNKTSISYVQGEHPDAYADRGYLDIACSDDARSHSTLPKYKKWSTTQK